MIAKASINLTKIDKKKLVQDKSGNLWLNIDVFINAHPDRYGNDVALAYTMTKAERESKQSRTYIGNGKVVLGKIPQNQQKAIQKDNEAIADSYDLPF